MIFILGSLFISAASSAQEVEGMQTIEISEEQIAQQQVDEQIGDEQIAEEQVEEPQSGSSITVYVKARFTRRTKGAAKSLTKSHREYEEMGYRFAALAPYTENGDLQGFFVTYTKN